MSYANLFKITNNNKFDLPIKWVAVRITNLTGNAVAIAGRDTLKQIKGFIYEKEDSLTYDDWNAYQYVYLTNYEACRHGITKITDYAPTGRLVT